MSRLHCFPLVTALALVQATAGASDRDAVPVTALAFSHDGKELVSNGPRRVDVRSARDGSVTGHFECDLPKITALAFHPRRGILAVAGGEPAVRGEVQLFKWPAKTLGQRIRHPDDIVTSIAFNGDGTLLGIAGSNHTARVWRLSTESSTVTEAFSLTGHSGPVLAIAFSPAGRTIVTASTDRSVKVWSAEDGRLLRSLSYHLEAVNALAFRPKIREPDYDSPEACATAGDDRTIRLWHPETGRMVRIIRQHRAAVLALAFAKDGSAIFSAGKEGIVRQFEADSDALITEWKAADDWIYSLAASPDGSTLAAGDWSGNVRILDLAAKK